MELETLLQSDQKAILEHPVRPAHGRITTAWLRNCHNPAVTIVSSGTQRNVVKRIKSTWT